MPAPGREGAVGSSMSERLFGVGVALDTAESRTFLQQRLATLVGMLCIYVTLIFAVGGSLMDLAETGPGPSGGRRILIDIGVAALLALTWLGLRLRKLTLNQLVLFDTAFTTGSGAMLAAVMYFTDVWPHTALAHVLAITHVLVARAALVPSSAPRTLSLGAFATFPIALITFEVATRTGVASASPLFSTSMVVAGGAIAVGSSSAVSSVVYGLRAKVREASHLGQYTIEKKLGEGGMGVVFKAHHALLRRPTAVKLLPPEKAGAENLVRFEREVQITATLTHPNTIAVYDYGRTPGGVLYYAMEYVDGISLQHLVEAHGPQPPGRVIHLLRQVCGSLYEAHCAGLVHRDVKPMNILLSHRGQVADLVKVVDFGLVKVIGSSVGVSAPDAKTVAGTPLYMSPEAILSPEEVGARTDIYALGAVAYFLLTGTPPFAGKTTAEIFAKHVEATPELPSARLGRAVPADLEAVILSCLTKYPSQRPTDARRLDAMLAACVDAGTWTTEEARTWWEEHSPLPRTEDSQPSIERTSGQTFSLPVDSRDRTPGKAA